MGLLSIFKHAWPAPRRREQRAGRRGAPCARRTLARQRLIGAVVLVIIGIIGFPLVFETQPRPIPVDIPIEVPRKEGAPALVMPPARTSPTPSTASAVPGVPVAAAPADVITESREEAGRDVAAAAPARAAALADRRRPSPRSGRLPRRLLRRSSRPPNTQRPARNPRRRAPTPRAHAPCSKAGRQTPRPNPGASSCRSARSPMRRPRTRDAAEGREAGPEDLHAGRQHDRRQPHSRAGRPVRQPRRGRQGDGQSQGRGPERCRAHAVR